MARPSSCIPGPFHTLGCLTRSVLLSPFYGAWSGISSRTGAPYGQAPALIPESFTAQSPALAQSRCLVNTCCNGQEPNAALGGLLGCPSRAQPPLSHLLQGTSSPSPNSFSNHPSPQEQVTATAQQCQLRPSQGQCPPGFSLGQGEMSRAQLWLC